MENRVATQIEDAMPFANKVRISIGSAILIGLEKGSISDPPKTIYLMTFFPGRCKANCGFCAQARESKADLEHLSRVAWPVFETEKVLYKIGKAPKEGIERICVQALNYPRVFNDLIGLIKAIKGISNLPVSISCQPLNERQMHLLKDGEVDRIAVSLDASTKVIFEKIKGLERRSSYRWETHLETLKKAVEIFGRGKVTTHIILGLEESERDFCFLFDEMRNMGVEVALFALTPIKGILFEKADPPPAKYYRRAHLARYLIARGIIKFNEIKFDRLGRMADWGLSRKVLIEAVSSGEPFLTSGCSGCNRPYYNEKVSGPVYNFPRPPTENETKEIEGSIRDLLHRGG